MKCCTNDCNRRYWPVRVRTTSLPRHLLRVAADAAHAFSVFWNIRRPALLSRVHAARHPINRNAA